MRDRKGFTLIELLIVVVIIGILAAIAIPKFSATREKAYFSAMKSDLRNLQTAQEMYYTSPNSDYSYAATTGELDFVESDGVSVAMDLEGTGNGWAATATHGAFDNAATESCEVWGGEVATPPTIPDQPGQVACVGEN